MAKLKAYQMGDRTVRVNVVGEGRRPDQDKVLYLRKDNTIAVYDANDKRRPKAA